jgi:signal peptidase II
MKQDFALSQRLQLVSRTQNKLKNSFKFLLLVIVDQITKLIFSSRDFFLGPIHFHEVKNFGLSFSLDFGLIINLSLVVAALAFFLYYFRYRVGLYLILAGAISNILDRIYFGYVRDFIDIGLFTFNLADAFIVMGLVWLLFEPDHGDKFIK